MLVSYYLYVYCNNLDSYFQMIQMKCCKNEPRNFKYHCMRNETKYFHSFIDHEDKNPHGILHSKIIKIYL